MEESVQITESQKKAFNRREIIIGAVALLFALALCVAALYYWEYIVQVRQYGYLGLFITGIFTSATAIIPIPGVLLVFTLGSILFPPLVGLFSGLGEAAGSTLIYLSGYGGNKALKKISYRFTDKFERWLKQRGSLAILTMSVITNPLFLPFTAVAGMMRFGLIKFFLLCFIGKTIKNTIIAYMGYFGLGALLRWIGVPI